MKRVHIRSTALIYKGIKLKTKFQHTESRSAARIKLKTKFQHTGSRSVAAVPLHSLELSLSSIVRHLRLITPSIVQGNLGALFKDVILFIRVFINAFLKLRNRQLRKYCPYSIYPVYLFRAKIAFQLINSPNTYFLLFTEPVFRERYQFPAFPPMPYHADEKIIMTDNSLDTVHI